MATILAPNKRPADIQQTGTLSLLEPTERGEWVDDAKVTSCAGCGNEFSFSLRKHHCRVCGNIFCWQCSEKRLELPKLGFSGPQRVCDACHGKYAASQTIRDNGLMSVQMLLREMTFFTFVEPLFEIGRRGPPSKTFSRVKLAAGNNQDESFLFSVIEPAEDASVIFNTDLKRKLFAMLLKEVVSHPYISEIVYAQLFEKKCVTVRGVYPQGSVRDKIYKNTNPLALYTEKYKSGRGQALAPALIARIGRQVLEGLFYLYVHGFPFPHIHAGNVLFNGNNVVISDIENSLLLVRPTAATHLYELKHIPSEVVAFGELVWEMALGFPRESHIKLASIKDSVPSEVYSVLEFIFEYTAPAGAPEDSAPSIKALLKHPFFREVKLEIKVHQSVLTEKWDERIRPLLKLVRHVTPKVLNPSTITSSGPASQLRRSVSIAGISAGSSPTASTSSTHSAASSSASSSSTRSSTTSSRHGSSPSTSRSRPASSSASAPAPAPAPAPASSSAPAPPPPPPPSVSLPPPQDGRGALLDSIRGGMTLRKVGPPKEKKRL